MLGTVRSLNYWKVLHASIGKRGPENNAKFTLGFKGVPVSEKRTRWNKSGRITQNLITKPNCYPFRLKVVN